LREWASGPLISYFARIFVNGSVILPFAAPDLHFFGRDSIHSRSKGLISMKRQSMLAHIAAQSKRPNRDTRHGLTLFDLSHYRLLERMRQIDVNCRARPINMACEIDFSMPGRALWPIVKGYFSRRMVRYYFCAIYLALLTMLLLSPNPAAAVGLKSIPFVPGGDTTMHLGSFIVLTILVHSMRWPKSLHWSFVAILLTYAAGSEWLQALVPPRTVEPRDFAANVFGIAVGSLVYWSLQRTFQVVCRLTDGFVKRWPLRIGFNSTTEPCLDINA
jgi:VanZ family protein